MTCCRQSFLAAIFQGSKSKTFTRTRKELIKPLRRFLKKALPDSQLINIAGCKISFPDLSATELRKRYVERFLRVSTGGQRSKHCLISFLQGLFIAYGYVQDPQKGYHLEIRIRGRWTAAALKRTSKFLNMKFSRFQKNEYTVFYTKSSRQIIKFFNKLGLFNKSLELSDFTATRNILSMVNRQVNSETANINRVVTAAEKNIYQIQRLMDSADQEFWTESLRQTALMRLRFPHDSIERLGSRFEPHLTKSAVNHRLRRINTIYSKLFPKSPGEEEPCD